MCGIVGYIGQKQASPVLLDGLEKLEYRGYDSAGMAVYNGTKIDVMKTKGRLQVLSDKSQKGSLLPGTAGIGHTRWATHGSPSDVNAHPHFNKDGSIVVVHNGIIENYLILRQELQKLNYQFASDTDTEVIAHLLEYYYLGNPLESIIQVMSRLEGSYALGVMFREHPDEIYAVRKDSPLVVGGTVGGNLIASDVAALLKYTRDVIYLENMEIAQITRKAITVFNSSANLVRKTTTHVDWDLHVIEKDGYDHFMLKEINEQPKVIRGTFASRIKDGQIVLNELTIPAEEIQKIRKLMIVACGSAYHVGMTAKYIFEGLAKLPVEVDVASEFRYRKPLLEKDTLVMIISQSGETADSLAALREAHTHGCKVLAIVNVVGSSIAREADFVLYTNAGPEIAVATTKAYSAQLITVYLLAMKIAADRGMLDRAEQKKMIAELEKLPAQVEVLLHNREPVREMAKKCQSTEYIFFIGRGIDYAICMEGSLKLKEISYIHSEAYAAGELKHGPISLIEEGTIVAALLTQKDLQKKMISNLVEVSTRGAFVLTVTEEGNEEAAKVSDYVFYIPETNPYFTNTLAIIPLQLFAYYIATSRGCDVDKPRNLAKSVTVE